VLSEHGRLFERLTDPKRQRAVINIDDDWQMDMRDAAFPHAKQEVCELIAERDAAIEAAAEATARAKASKSDEQENSPPNPEDLPLSPVLTYSLKNKSADVHAISTEFSIWETKMLVHTPRGVLELITPLIGRMNAYYTLASVAAAVALDIPLQAIVDALSNAEVRWLHVQAWLSSAGGRSCKNLTSVHATAAYLDRARSHFSQISHARS
jgi:UDP-N-acetylmuramyl tripeptide synthase